MAAIFLADIAVVSLDKISNRRFRALEDRSIIRLCRRRHNPTVTKRNRKKILIENIKVEKRNFDQLRVFLVD